VAFMAFRLRTFKPNEAAFVRFHTPQRHMHHRPNRSAFPPGPRQSGALDVSAETVRVVLAVPVRVFLGECLGDGQEFIQRRGAFRLSLSSQSLRITRPSMWGNVPGPAGRTSHHPTWRVCFGRDRCSDPWCGRASAAAARPPARPSLLDQFVQHGSRLTMKMSGRLLAAAAALILVSWSAWLEGSVTSFRLIPSFSLMIL